MKPMFSSCSLCSSKHCEGNDHDHFVRSMNSREQIVLYPKNYLAEFRGMEGERLVKSLGEESEQELAKSQRLLRKGSCILMMNRNVATWG